MTATQTAPTTTADTAAPFFEAGREYVAFDPYKAPEQLPQFRCLAVGVNPRVDELRAFGFHRAGHTSPWYSVALTRAQWERHDWLPLDEPIGEMPPAPYPELARFTSRACPIGAPQVTCDHCGEVIAVLEGDDAIEIVALMCSEHTCST